MPKHVRNLKPSPEGNISRSKLAAAVASIHVYPVSSHHEKQWHVREIARGVAADKTFDTQQAAITYAKSIAAERHSQVILHKQGVRLRVGSGRTSAVYEVVRGKTF